jgi:hypothetical protein
MSKVLPPHVAVKYSVSQSYHLHLLLNPPGDYIPDEDADIVKAIRSQGGISESKTLHTHSV